MSSCISVNWTRRWGVGPELRRIEGDFLGELSQGRTKIYTYEKRKRKKGSILRRICKTENTYVKCTWSSVSSVLLSCETEWCGQRTVPRSLTWFTYMEPWAKMKMTVAVHHMRIPRSMMENSKEIWKAWRGAHHADSAQIAFVAPISVGVAWRGRQRTHKNTSPKKQAHPVLFSTCIRAKHTCSTL